MPEDIADLKPFNYPFLGAPAFDLDSLYDEPVAPIPWAVEALIAEKDATLLSGEGYIGKTYLLIDLAIQLAVGGRWLTHFQVTKSYRVLYLDKEMSDNELKRRFQRMLRGLPPDTPRPHKHLYTVPYGRLVLDGNQPQAQRELAAILDGEGIQFMLVDSMRKLIPGDENQSDTAARFHDAFNDLRSRVKHSFGITGIAHWNKTEVTPTGAKRRISERLRGSGAWRDMSDAHLCVEKGKAENTMLVTPDKSRHGLPHEPFSVRFTHHEVPATDSSPFHMEVIGLGRKAPFAADNQRIAEFIGALAEEAALGREEIAAACGVTVAAVRYNAENLLREGRISWKPGGGRGHKAVYWKKG